MAGTQRKVKRFVIDVSSYITIFINRETDWLLHYIVQNKIEIFVDNLLIAELTRVLNYPKIKNILPLDAIYYISFVRIISTHIVAKSFQIQSPDPEDNYLYDLSLSAHAKLLVTGDGALVSWVDSPVETISLSMFKTLFRNF